MIINPVEVIKTDDSVKIQALIEYADKKEYLWYSFPIKYAPYLTTEKLDGFLVGLLLLAMKLGEDIEVKGTISEKLFFNLTRSYISILKILLPELKKINIKVNNIDDGKNADCKGAVVTGFSAGIDSFCTIYDHYVNSTSPGYKITHLIFNNVGSHDEWNGKKGRKLFNLRYNLLKGFPEELGLDFIKVDSNLSDILRFDFMQSHVPRNASVVLMLQKLFSKYYYSSAHKYIDCGVKPKYAIAKADPIGIHLLSTETLDCISTGCEYSRLEKTKMVTKIPQAKHWLNICVKSVDGKNCSTCWKCSRTLLTFEILGIIDDFKHVFDLEQWRKYRTQCLVQLLEKNDPHIKEIRNYAKEVGYTFKTSHIIRSKIYRKKSHVLDFLNPPSKKRDVLQENS